MAVSLILEMKYLDEVNPDTELMEWREIWSYKKIENIAFELDDEWIYYHLAEDGTDLDEADLRHVKSVLKGKERDYAYLSRVGTPNYINETNDGSLPVLVVKKGTAGERWLKWLIRHKEDFLYFSEEELSNLQTEWQAEAISDAIHYVVSTKRLYQTEDHAGKIYDLIDRGIISDEIDTIGSLVQFDKVCKQIEEVLRGN